MIEVEHLSKIYGSTPAIQDVTFAVPQGEILGFLGPNGAGKTTTMRILAGYLPATTGTARIAGYEVHEDSMAVRQRIGYLPELPPLYPQMTVEGFLYFVARLKHVPAGDRDRQVESALQRCNLEEKRRVLIRKLSKGFRQRVGIAQAIVHDPPVIILDEPTVGLDPRQIIDMRNLIKSLAGERTIILSTHILPEVSMTCSRWAIINRGRVVATDTSDSAAGYELELEGDVGEAQQRLQALPGIISVEPIRTERILENRHRLRVLSESGIEPAPDIVAALVAAGQNLYEIRRTRTSLEDVFLEVTREEAPEHEGSEGEPAPETLAEGEESSIPDKGEEIAEETPESESAGVEAATKTPENEDDDVSSDLWA